jgi:hypothetical protein
VTCLVCCGVGNAVNDDDDDDGTRGDGGDQDVRRGRTILSNVVYIFMDEECEWCVFLPDCSMFDITCLMKRF